MKLLAIRIIPASVKHDLQQEVASLKEQHAKAVEALTAACRCQLEQARAQLARALEENAGLAQQLQQAAAAAAASAPAGAAAQAQGSGGLEAETVAQIGGARRTSGLNDPHQGEQVRRLEAQVEALAAQLHEAQAALAGAQRALAEERAAHQQGRAEMVQRQQETRHALDSTAATQADQAGAITAAAQMPPGGKLCLAAQLQQAATPSDGIKAITHQQHKQGMLNAQIGLPVRSAAAAPAGAPCLAAATLSKSLLERLIEDDSWWPALHGGR